MVLINITIMEAILDDDDYSWLGSIFDMSSDEEDGEPQHDWHEKLKCIKENDPLFKSIDSHGVDIQNIMADEEYEELGRDIANNTHLIEVGLTDALNDQKMSLLFRGLTRSSSLKEMFLCRNELSVAGVRSMVPFLQANNLRQLFLNDNNIQSEGFNLMFRALRDSPIVTLCCHSCGIKSIEIDGEYIPRNLTLLDLGGNIINADGCHGLATLLQGGNATLKCLYLPNNQIGDEGIAILVNALQNNTSLQHLGLFDNDISLDGQTMLLKLVNDISSIKATLRSNHTLRQIDVDRNKDDQLQWNIITATLRNRDAETGAVGKAKVIQTQLVSGKRAELAEILGVNHSLYNEIDPLHLPEVLALVGHHHGQRELYVALRSSIAGVISIVDEKQCIRQQMAYYAAKLEELGTRLAAIEAADSAEVHDGSEYVSIKKRRVC